MKKILLVTRPIAPPWDEASKNFAYFLAKNLGENFESNLMTRGILPGQPDNIRQHPVYTTSEISQFDFLQKLRSLYFQFKTKGQFDINHYFFTPTKLNSFLIKRLLKSPRSKTIQTVAALREDLWSDENIKGLIFSDLVITYSDYAKNKLKSLGFDNVIRIYPGIDIEKYQGAAKDTETMQRFGIAREDFVISYPGEYTRLGATDDIVNALPSLFEEIPHAKFMFACRVKNDKDARKKEEIIAKLESKSLLERVIFTDTFADMPKIYNISDIVIFPVRDMKGKFDVPLAVIEAMACEKPVVISDLPILKEFANSDNSVIIETGNAQALLTSLKELYKDASKRQVLGAGARKYIAENFDIRDVADKYRQTYDNL